MADIRRGPTADGTRRSESGFEVGPGLRPGRRRAGPGRAARRAGGATRSPAVSTAPCTPQRPWTMRQYAGFGTARESNERYHQLLRAGTTGLSVAFDLPTQMGYDSDDPVAHGEVGKVGVAIDSVDDMRLLFDGIPLGEVSTSMTINSPAALLLLLYQLVAEEQGVAGRQAQRHDPERRAEGVRRPRHVHLPAGAVAPAGHGHVRVLRGRDPPLEHDLDLRLPHGRGRRDARPGDRLHARQRRRVRPGRGPGRARRRRLRPAAGVLLRLPDHAAGGGREVPGGAADLGPGDARRVRRDGTRSRRCCASTPRPPACS